MSRIHTQLSTPIVLLFIGLMWLFSVTTLASTPALTIKDNPINLEDFSMGYYVDHSESMSLSKVRKQTFKLATNRLSLGTESKVTWTKFILNNMNNHSKTLYLHHPHAYHNKAVEVYEVVNGEVINERLLDMDNSETWNWMYRGSAVFGITLEPNQPTTVFVKSHSFSHQWFALNLYDEDQSKRALLGQFTDIAIVSGMLLALIIYNLLLFFSSRLREHFYYACYLVSGGFWIALSYGLFADLFNVYGSTTLKWHLSLVAMPIFLLLFMIKVFETRKKYPVEHWALIFVLTLLSINFIYGLFDIVTALKYSSTLAAIMMAISLSVSLSMLFRREPIALFFLIGHGLFVIFSVRAVFFYKGMSEFSYINSHGVGIGILLEALVLSLIISYRIRILEKLKTAQAELKLLAATDPLTQLFNRRQFNNSANTLLNRPDKTQKLASVTIMDIDHFKNINDSYGHSFGDKTIQCVADIIKSNSRQQDIVARYGGEEFIILMPDTSTDEAFLITERIRKSLEKTKLTVEKSTFTNVSISAGIAEVTGDSKDLQDAINHADTALYQAKNNGRNQSQIYHPAEQP